MKPCARISVNQTNLYVRFARVGRFSRFDVVLDSFRQAFLLATWDESHRGWALPIERLNSVRQWCIQTFGESNVLVQEDTTSRIKTQEPIFSQL